MYGDSATLGCEFYCIRHKVEQELKITMGISPNIFEKRNVFFLEYMSDYNLFLR